MPNLMMAFSWWGVMQVYFLCTQPCNAVVCAFFFFFLRMALWTSLFRRDVVERQPRVSFCHSVTVQITKGTDMQSFSTVSILFSMLSIIQPKSFKKILSIIRKHIKIKLKNLFLWGLNELKKKILWGGYFSNLCWRVPYCVNSNSKVQTWISSPSYPFNEDVVLPLYCLPTKKVLGSSDSFLLVVGSHRPHIRQEAGMCWPEQKQQDKKVDTLPLERIFL